MSNTRFNLQELLTSIQKIALYSADYRNGDDFYHDQKSFDASMMQFVVIGEIITRLDSSYKTEHPQIPWQKIKNFRNIIAHDYFGIDADEIWDICFEDLEAYEKVVIKLIKEIDPILKHELIEAFKEDNRYLDFIIKASVGIENE